MALYLGSSGKRKIVLNGVVYRFCLPIEKPEEPIVSSNRLLSSDNYILKDSNGFYLTVKEDE